MGKLGWEEGSSQHLTWRWEEHDRGGGEFPLHAFNHHSKYVGHITKEGLWHQSAGFRMSPGCLEQVKMEQWKHGFKKSGRKLFWDERRPENLYDAYDVHDEKIGYLKLEQVGKHTHWCWHQEIGEELCHGENVQVRKKQRELSHDRKLRK